MNRSKSPSSTTDQPARSGRLAQTRAVSRPKRNTWLLSENWSLLSHGQQV